MIDYAEIEDGIKTLLTPLIQTHGVRTLDIYSGEMNSIPELIECSIIYPAILINVRGFTNAIAGTNIERAYNLRIIFADTHARGDQKARGGAQNLASGARVLLASKYIPGGNAAILLVSEQEEFYSRLEKLCVWSGTYNIRMR